MLPIASYSFLRDNENCPKKAYHLYVARDLPRESPTPEQTFGNDVHHSFERRINEGTPLIEPLVPLAGVVERILRCKANGDIVRAEAMLAVNADLKPSPWSGQNTWLRGKLDVMIIHGNSAVIFDWKTGKTREDAFELEVQALLLKCHYPTVEKISGNYIWLKNCNLGATHDLSDTDRTAASVRAQLAEAVRRGLQAWPARQNPLCPWCPVPKSKCEFSSKEA
jgi:hypothetical protein